MRLVRRGETASSLDLLVVGLGNPGREHATDRHNVGWMVVDELARRHDGSFRSKFSGQLSEVRLDELRLALLKPETYMNDSGRSLGAAARFFKVPVEAIAVVHDDVDLEPGRLQARLGGGLAGHNGLRSVAAALGSPDFLRLRSAWAARDAATGATSPTTCCRRSSRKTIPRRSSSARPTPSRRSHATGSRRRSAASTRTVGVIELPFADPGRPDIALAVAPAPLGRAPPARDARGRYRPRDRLDALAGADALHDRAGDRAGARRGRRLGRWRCGSASCSGSEPSRRSRAGSCATAFAVFNWLQASFRLAQVVSHHSARVGPAIRGRHTTGEVVATVSNDAMRAGGAFDITARLLRRHRAYVVVAVMLRLVVRGARPGRPAGRPGARPAARLRDQAAAGSGSVSSASEVGKLTALGADTASGLRVLRGIGGERRLLRPLPRPLARGAAGGRAGRAAAVDARRGAGLHPGPLRRARHLARRPLRGLGQDRPRRARCVLWLRRLPRDPAADGRGGCRQGHARPRRRAADARRPRGRAARRRPPHPARCRRRRPARGRAVGARGRARPAHLHRLRPPGRGGRDRRPARPLRRRRRVALGGVGLADLPLAAVRRRIVVSEADPVLFSGTLRTELDPWGRAEQTRRSSRPSPSPTPRTSSTSFRPASTARSTSAAARSRAASGNGSCSPARSSSPTPRCSSSSSRRAPSTRTPRRASRRD